MRALFGSTVATLLVACLLGCDGGAPAAATHPATADAAIKRVQLRRTTAAELRAALGDPVEQAPDGALVYRFAGVGRRRDETETVRFRFERGTLSKICRDRS